jgi:hypothetical protein
MLLSLMLVLLVLLTLMLVLLLLLFLMLVLLLLLHLLSAGPYTPHLTLQHLLRQPPVNNSNKQHIPVCDKQCKSP